MSGARLHDLGYRRYDGARLGPSAAVRSLARHTFGALVGRRRSVWAKLVTVAIAGFAYAPALVFLGLALFVPAQITDQFLPGSDEYLGIVTMPVWLFLVLGSPLALCQDRRSGVLALYLASSLDRDRYLLAKAAAVFGFLAIVTIGPSLFLLLGRLLVGVGPRGVDVLVELARVIAAGVLYSLVFGGFGLALSSLTERRTAAAAAIAMWLVGSGILVNAVLLEALDRSETIALLEVTSIANEVVRRTYGAEGGLPELPTAAVFLGAAGWIVATLAFTRWRLHRLQVTR